MAKGELTIDFWDVGQGDCSVIMLPNGKLIIIDVGPRNSPIISWLQQRPRAIHSVILTHNDADHNGCLLSLLEIPGQSIDHVLLLKDKPRNTKIFQTLGNKLATESAAGRYDVGVLRAGITVWADKVFESNIELKVIYPSPISDIFAKTTNQSSAILALQIDGVNQVIWPGDQSLENTAVAVQKGPINELVGPHHGCPEDRKEPRVSKWLADIDPRNCFISVGSNNSYPHPNKTYLKKIIKQGCKVQCSQVTRQCAPELPNKPILNSSMLLGLLAPPTGVACRGSKRLKVTPAGMINDGLNEEHAVRIKKLRRPMCLS